MFWHVVRNLLLIGFISIASLGQEVAPPVPQRLVIHSHVLNEDRVIWVRLPAVAVGSRSGFPVLYMTDAGGNINEIGSTIDFLVDNNEIPPLIVVGSVSLWSGWFLIFPVAYGPLPVAYSYLNPSIGSRSDALRAG